MISIRIKLFAVVVGTLVATILIYLVLAVRLFEDDKQAFVFDASASLVEAVATETEGMVGGVIGTLRLAAALVADAAAEDRGRARLADELFDGNSDLVALSVATTAGEPILIRERREFLELFHLDGADLQALSRAFIDRRAELKPDEVVVRGGVLPGGVPVLSIGALLSRTDGPPRVVVGHARQDRLLRIFGRSSQASMFLVDARGDTLVHPDSKLIGVNQGVSDPAFAEHVLASQFRTGTKELVGEGGERWLTAFSKIGTAGGLVVVARTSREKAFEASRRLVSKSVLFAIALVLSSILVSFLFTRTLTRPINRLFEATKALALGDFTVRVERTTSDEIGVLATSFNSMAGRIVHLMGEVRDKARMEAELETARLVQENLFPKDRAESDAYELAGFYKPASECGGDWWGYFTNEERLYVLIGDATGHGIPAALITAAAQSCATTLQEFKRSQPDSPMTPASIMSYLNRAIFYAANRSMNMTFLVAMLDLKTGELTYCNASHEMPTVVSLEADGTASIEALVGEPDRCLGDSLELPFQEHQVQLRPGDTIVWYTDGLTESQNEADVEWGERRFFKVMKANAAKKASEICETLTAESTAFRGKKPADDDITYIVVRWHGDGSAAGSSV